MNCFYQTSKFHLVTFGGDKHARQRLAAVATVHARNVQQPSTKLPMYDEYWLGAAQQDGTLDNSGPCGSGMLEA